MRFPRFNKVSFLIFLSVMGPGIITSAVDNDAGGIATYSVAGANFGYSLLWLLIPITVALIVVQEMCTRMGVVTGKGLSDLIRKNFGARVTVFVMLLLLVANIGNTMAEFAGVAASAEILGMSRYIAVPIAAIAVWLLVVKGNYKKVERIFLVATLFYITYVISGLLSGPNWGEVGSQFIAPSFSFNSAYLFMVIGIVGTTIAPWMQFYIQASIVEKKIELKNYKYTKMDVIIGSFITAAIAFFIIVACAATLYAANIHINDAADAAVALRPLAGNLASYLFAFGLLTASLFAAAILPLATAYYVCEGFGWEKGVDKSFKEASKFYWLYTGLILIGAIFVLTPGVSFISILLISQVMNGILLPFILIFMIIIINDKDVMGKYTNGKFFNIIAWGTTIILIILTILLVVSSVWPGALAALFGG
ncbi:MAG: Nramp family divalent metal transporter [Candidatus Aenigmarchaeota archaeon]|nr:Nramp family divalent metal transporter [Candidatus Aenigmarchaeota archaeon]